MRNNDSKKYVTHSYVEKKEVKDQESLYLLK
nr:MAG TPA: hypothetical protein [Caudoviricetes sp.]